MKRSRKLLFFERIGSFDYLQTCLMCKTTEDKENLYNMGPSLKDFNLLPRRIIRDHSKKNSLLSLKQFMMVFNPKSNVISVHFGTEVKV